MPGIIKFVESVRVVASGMLGSVSSLIDIENYVPTVLFTNRKNRLPKFRMSKPCVLLWIDPILSSIIMAHTDRVKSGGSNFDSVAIGSSRFLESPLKVRELVIIWLLG